jgi:hypothetical protein
MKRRFDLMASRAIRGPGSSPDVHDHSIKQQEITLGNHPKTMSFLAKLAPFCGKETSPAQSPAPITIQECSSPGLPTSVGRSSHSGAKKYVPGTLGT